MKLARAVAAILSALCALLALPASAASDAASCGACAGCGGVMILIPIAIIVLNIMLLVWVAKDAKSRGMDGSILWMLLVFFTGPVGLIVYLLVRPKGNLIKCASCGNKRLETSAKCPHCGNP